MNVPFDTQQLADSRVDVRHFRVSFATPAISAISMCWPMASWSVLDRSARRAAVATAASLATTQGAGKLALHWNADAEPYAAVLYVAADGRKTVVASALTGGSAAVDVSALPAGGRFEVSLSSSVRGRMVKVARQ